MTQFCFYLINEWNMVVEYDWKTHLIPTFLLEVYNRLPFPEWPHLPLLGLPGPITLHHSLKFLSLILGDQTLHNR